MQKRGGRCGGYIQTNAEKRKQTGETIKRKEWEEHFTNVLNGKEERTVSEKRMIVMPQGDVEQLNDIEIEEQIDKQNSKGTRRR